MYDVSAVKSDNAVITNSSPVSIQMHAMNGRPCVRKNTQAK